MRDIFHNYDNHIDHKDYLKYCKHKHKKQISSKPTVQIIYDTRKNPVGVKCKRNTQARLFFHVDGEVCGYSIDEFLKLGRIYFELLTTRHKVILKKDVSENVFNDTIKVDICADETIPSNIYGAKLYMEVGPDPNVEEAEPKVEVYSLFEEADAFIDLL